MLKKLSALLLTFALVSCNSGSNTGADGYKFGKAQYERQQVQINVVTYQKQSDLLKVAAQHGASSPTVVAFSVLKPPFDTCTIHMIDPRVRYEPEYVGHEFLHCVYGQWHTDNNTYK